MVDRWMDECWMDGGTDRQMMDDRWIDKWKDGWMAGWMTDGCV